MGLGCPRTSWVLQAYEKVRVECSFVHICLEVWNHSTPLLICFGFAYMQDLCNSYVAFCVVILSLFFFIWL